MPKDPLDNLPKIHPRERLVTEAENELRRACIEALSKLSTAECIQVINNVAHSEIALIIRQAIRMERHGAYEHFLKDPRSYNDRNDPSRHW